MMHGLRNWSTVSNVLVTGDWRLRDSNKQKKRKKNVNDNEKKWLC